MVIPEFGNSDLFEERDVERPEPGVCEVLVRVIATSVNPIDTKLRADGSFAGLEPPVILGGDVSGVVEEVGPGVTEFAPGDEVYYTPEVFGPDSNQYEQAGGTRLSDRKRPTRKTPASPAS